MGLTSPMWTRLVSFLTPGPGMGSVTPGSPRPCPRRFPRRCHPPHPRRPPNHPRCHLCHHTHPRNHPSSQVRSHPASQVRSRPLSLPLNQAVSLPFPPSQAYSRPNLHPQVQLRTPQRPPLGPPLIPPLMLNSWVNDLQTIDKGL